MAKLQPVQSAKPSIAANEAGGDPGNDKSAERLEKLPQKAVKEKADLVKHSFVDGSILSQMDSKVPETAATAQKKRKLDMPTSQPSPKKARQGEESGNSNRAMPRVLRAGNSVERQGGIFTMDNEQKREFEGWVGVKSAEFNQRLEKNLQKEEIEGEMEEYMDLVSKGRQLIDRAEQNEWKLRACIYFTEKLNHTVQELAASHKAFAEARDRHREPPGEFQEWVNKASDHSALMAQFLLEDFLSEKMMQITTREAWIRRQQKRKEHRIAYYNALRRGQGDGAADERPANTP